MNVFQIGGKEMNYTMVGGMMENQNDKKIAKNNKEKEVWGRDAWKLKFQ